MSNRGTHVTIGLGVAGVVVVLVVVLADEDRRLRLAGLVGTGAGVIAGAVLPDEPEPDTSNHPDTAHNSLVALYGSGHVSLAPPLPLATLKQKSRDRADQLHDQRHELSQNHGHLIFSR